MKVCFPASEGKLWTHEVVEGEVRGLVILGGQGDVLFSEDFTWT